MTTDSTIDTVPTPLISQAIDLACANAKGLHSVPLAVVTDLGIESSPLARELCDLFHHHIRINHGGSDGYGAEISFVQPSDPPTIYPRPLLDTPDGVTEWWRALANGVTHPLAAAFLNDILFCARDSDAGTRALQAFGSYLEAADLPALDVPTTFECALRAWTLARRTKNPASELAARESVASRITADLSSGNALIPGLTLPALATITAPHRCCGPDRFDLDALVDRALELYGTADHIDVLAEIVTLRRGSDPTVRSVMRRMRVQVRLDAGDGTDDAATKLHWYEQAARLAAEFGIADLREEATRSLQAIDTSTLPWERISLDVTPPPHLVEAFANQIVRSGWRRGLIAWLSSDAPSGRYESNLKQTRSSLAGTVLISLMPTWSFGAHGLPQKTLEPSQDEIPDPAIRDAEYISSLVHGGLLAEALDRIGGLRATTDLQDVAEVIRKHYSCDAPDALILARALHLYWRGDYLEAAHLITPFTENGARRLLLLLDEAIYRVEEAKKKKIGQFLGLGSLLPLLKRQGLDQDWVRYLDTLLLSDGKNYRNLIAHGFVYDIDRVTAALLIRASAFLLLMPGLPNPDKAKPEPATPVLATAFTFGQRLRLAANMARWVFDSTRP